MFVKKSILKIIVAGVVTIVNAANADADAAPTRGLRAESLESRDVPAVNIVPTFPSMRLRHLNHCRLPTTVVTTACKLNLWKVWPAPLLSLKMKSRHVSKPLSSMMLFRLHNHRRLLPTTAFTDHVSKQKTISSLASILAMPKKLRRWTSSFICPGTIHFYDEIVLDDSITLSCAGTKGSCILDGNEATRHFVSGTASLTLSFIDLAFINGFADDSSNDPGFGGSLDFFGSRSTIIIDGSLFYNNHVTSSSFGVVSIIFI